MKLMGWEMMGDGYWVMGDGCWVLMMCGVECWGKGVGCWVMMMCGFTMNFIETINTHHSTPNPQPTISPTHQNILTKYAK